MVAEYPVGDIRIRSLIALCRVARTSARIRALFRLCRTFRHGQFLARMVQADDWQYSTMAMQVACSPMTAMIRTWSPGLGLRQCGNCEKLSDGLGLGVARSLLGWSPSLSRSLPDVLTVSEPLTVSGFIFAPLRRFSSRLYKNTFLAFPAV